MSEAEVIGVFVFFAWTLLMLSGFAAADQLGYSFLDGIRSHIPCSCNNWLFFRLYRERCKRHNLAPRAGGTGVTDRLKRYIPDDEILSEGYFFMERMDDDHIWFNAAGYSFDLRIKNSKITMEPQNRQAIDTELKKQRGVK